MISVLAEEEGGQGLMLLGSWGQRESETARERDKGGIGGVPAYMSREESLGEWLEMMELEIVRENTKNAMSFQFKEGDLGVDKLSKEEKIT